VCSGIFPLLVTLGRERRTVQPGTRLLRTRRIELCLNRSNLRLKHRCSVNAIHAAALALLAPSENEQARHYRVRWQHTACFLTSFSRFAISASYELECTDELLIDSIFAYISNRTLHSPNTHQVVLAVAAPRVGTWSEYDVRSQRESMPALPLPSLGAA
jgi:hypothetical protein